MRSLPFIIGLSLLFLSLPLSAQDVWLVKKMGEMTTADFYLMEIGSPLTGITIGKKNSGGGSDELLCFYMTNGEQWNPCPASLTNFSMGGGAFLLGARYQSASSLFAVRTEIKGFNSVTALVKLDANLFNMLVTKVFDNDADPVNGAMEVIGDTVWIGTTDGRIYKSVDAGATFTAYTVTTDTKVQIYFIRFSDQMNGYLAGGATEETTDREGNTIQQLIDKGGVWKTNDGGETWTAIKENLPYGFLKIFPIGGTGFSDISTGRWYALYTDADSYSDPSNITKHIGVTENNFGTLVENDPVANTSRKLNGYQAYGMDLVGEKELWLGGFCMDFKACSMVSYDGGDTWIEMFLPTDVGAAFMWSFRAQAFLDSHHGYAAGSLNTIFKFGDPNEVYTQPDDTPVADDAALPDEAESDSDEPAADEEASDEIAADTATGDTEAGSDSDALLGEDPSCGCSLVY